MAGEKVFGYELLFRDGVEDHFRETDAAAASGFIWIRRHSVLSTKCIPFVTPWLFSESASPAMDTLGRYPDRWWKTFKRAAGLRDGAGALFAS
jgi:hypothetical protein